MKNNPRSKLKKFESALFKGSKSMGKWMALNFQDPIILNKYVWLNIGIYLERSNSRIKQTRALEYYEFSHKLGCNYSCLRFAHLSYWLFERDKKNVSNVIAKKAYVLCKKAEKTLVSEQKAEAINLLGCFHFTGFGCTKNLTKSMRYYKQASKLGNNTAKLNLSNFNIL